MGQCLNLYERRLLYANEPGRPVQPQARVRRISFIYGAAVASTLPVLRRLKGSRQDGRPFPEDLPATWRHCTSLDVRQKMLPTMFIVTTVYSFCWLPLNVFNILRALYPLINEYTYVLHVWWACHTVAMVHCMVNPIIYVSRNRRFREGFAYVFQWLPGVHFDPYSMCLFNTSMARGSSVQASIVQPLHSASISKVRTQSAATVNDY
uniref:G_PROTEIN_RECEP_F1_2 domain-containing protein n=1 Tax=Trichuris muris TaxID=70415 RepID=A0A5S6R5C8_TRIMR